MKNEKKIDVRTTKKIDRKLLFDYDNNRVK